MDELNGLLVTRQIDNTYQGVRQEGNQYLALTGIFQE